MGYDNIPPKIIKWAPHLFGPILLSIFNKCLHLGYYPNAMKVARVVPIHKGGDINDINNYRPISVLTQFNRLFERILASRLMDFFEKNEIITSKQFGFMKKHSTEHAILDLKEYITQNLVNKKITAVLFLDLKKAFDSVSHPILLSKLSHYGIRGAPHALLASYLSDRRQYTSVDGFKSNLDFIRWGVPQGSVLGPLLFLLFINDLPNSCNLNSWLFADDTALAESSDNFQDLQCHMNREIQKLQKWLQANLLSVHYVKKTQYILFIPRGKEKDKPPDFEIKMGENIIEETATYKYLGVIIDNRLSWKPQIDKMCAKMSSVCGVISKVRHVLDRNSMLLIYNSLVENRLRYGILSWSTASTEQLNRLKVLQNRALRYIDFSPISTTILPIYAQFNVLPLGNLIDLHRATYMFSLSKNDLPLVFRSYCKRPTHGYATRFSEANFTIPKHNSRLSESSIKYLGPSIWSRIPIHLKKLQFRKTFSNHLKQLYLDDLPSKKRTKEINFSKNDLDGNTIEQLPVIVEETNETILEIENSFSLEDIFKANDDDFHFFGF